MAIAAIGEFVRYAILIPLSDMFVLIYGLLEPIIRHLTPDHPSFIYSNLAVVLWNAKLLSSIIGLTAQNGTLTAAFNDTLHTLSVNSNNFFGNITGKSGMSYIAKHAYIELTSDKALANEMAVKFVRVLNNTVIYIMEAFVRL